VDLLKRIEWVRNSALSGPDKLAIYTEMEHGLPPEQFCHTAPKSLEIVRQELANGRTKETPSASGKRRPKVSTEVHSEEEPLLQQSNENARGPRSKKAVVK